MDYFICNFIKRIFLSFNGSLLIIFFAYAFICFLLALVFSLLSKKTDKEYIIFCSAGLLLNIAVISVLKVEFFYCFFYGFFCVFFYGVKSFFSGKKKDDEDEFLTKLIDKEIDKPLPKIEPDIPSIKSEETDFTHVKNVIERLSFYPLSPNDKKLIRELKENVFFAEIDGVTDPLRDKINDGLSNLLKIMSKHGV